MIGSRRLGSLAAFFAVVLLFGPAPNGWAESFPIAPVNAPAGLGLKGFDPVAYFAAGKPTPGVGAYEYSWRGTRYRFASADNLERFRQTPEAYLPEYGGYCAFAMSNNLIADIDPARWAIVDGKLYLNNNRVAYGLWAIDKQGNIAAGDRHWAVFPKQAEPALPAEAAR